MKKIKLGDIVEIPLRDEKKAYGQYVYWDKKMGPLLQVFDLIGVNNVRVEEIDNAKPLFPPVITGLNAAVRTGLWKIVGNLPVKNFVYPGFISTFFDDKTGKASIWYLWNGNEEISLGNRLPKKYRKMEFLVVWSPLDVVERIETGVYLYPYGDLIRFNHYKPMNT